MTSVWCVLSAALAAMPQPVAVYDFETAGAPGRDASGQGHDAQCEGAVVAAPGGHSLRLDGRGGLDLPAAPALRTTGGFAFECRVRFDDVNDNVALVSKADEFFVRLDPPNEGGQLSFFVHAGGSAEPRVRGPKPKPGDWYHVLATWNGQVATLWVNGIEYRRQRTGAVAPTDHPITVGRAYRWAPVGLKGELDEVRFYDRALTAADILPVAFALDRAAEGPVYTVPRLELATDLAGWEAYRTAPPERRGDEVHAEWSGSGAGFVRRGLAIPLAGRPLLSLRLAASDGRSGRVVYLTDAGAGVAEFALRSDGAWHSYVLDLGGHPSWAGTLRALALCPSDVAATVKLGLLAVGERAEVPPDFAFDEPRCARLLPRAGRPETVQVALTNLGGDAGPLTVRLIPPADVRVAADEHRLPALAHGARTELTWDVTAEQAGRVSLRVEATGDNGARSVREASLFFAPAVTPRQAAYVPEPEPVDTGELLVGAHYCPLWKQGSRPGGWELITPYPERQPLLGWYDEHNPEVTDWEIKWALDHGITYFVYCWYRDGQGGPVEHRLGHAIHEGLFHSRYGDRFRFAIMWENQSKGRAGVASEEDFLTNLMPYWIDNYFRRDNYLKVDGKPLLFIYRPEYLVEDLGGVAAVRSALDKARRMCVDAGLGGLTILGEYRGTDPRPLQLMVDEGLDYSFAYCWPVANNPDPPTAIAAQEAFWEAWRRLNVIPGVLTVSMGWDSTPWHPTFSAWRLPPNDFQTLCERAKAFMATLPEGSLARRMVLLDNWNEFGEGHYIFPHRQYGFGYLDAVRRAFANAPEAHVDLVPEDLGLGPYDSLFAAYQAGLVECARRVVAEGLDRDLVGYWSFDEDPDAPVAYDWTGHGQGGRLDGARRVPGLFGNALECAGGCVVVPRGAFEQPVEALTIECWIRTELAGQSDKWFVNNLFGDGSAGVRLGLSEGRLSFGAPLARWSPHLVAAEPLPLGEWVHVAATYDGDTMRLYMAGRQVAETLRGGPLQPSRTQLCLGSYDAGHRAHFTGLLDEVKIYRRALSAAEVASHAEANR